MQINRRSFLATIGASLAAPAIAQTNVPTLGVMSGEPQGTFVQIANDLRAVVDPTQLRILPVEGLGSVQNVGDLINVKGVDLALMAADALPYVKAQGMYQGAIDRIQYICKLYNNDIHVCAGPDIKTVQDLDGKPVNCDVLGSGTDLTTRTVFGMLGIKPIFRNTDPATGQVDLMAGTIAANVYCVGRPGQMFKNVSASANLHLVPVPSNEAVEKIYLPGGVITHDDYPTLVPEGQEVETVGVGVALANFGWQPGSARYRLLATFVQQFFTNFPRLLQPPHHRAWKDVNLRATLPGWTRFQPAADWLNQQMQKSEFVSFAASKGVQLTPQSADELFRQFQQWQAARGR